MCGGTGERVGFSDPTWGSRKHCGDLEGSEVVLEGTYSPGGSVAGPRSRKGIRDVV